MTRTFAKLLTFQTIVGDGPSILPFVVVAPRYFSGALALGDMMKVGNGFGQISIALSWLVNSFADYAAWHATVDRVTEFDNYLKVARSRPRTALIENVNGALIAFDQVAISLPRGEELFSDLSFELKTGEAVLFRGQSGIGKTTLFRVLSGMWPFVSGQIHIPEKAQFLFLPQDTYLPIGSLRSILCFPKFADTKYDQEIIVVLRALGLEYLAVRLSEERHWEQCLSAGERQRIAIAQAVLSKPDWLFLDEPTSALDEGQEAIVYRFLKDSLPLTTIISIGHRKSAEAYHSRVISLDPFAHAQDPLLSGNCA